ncbi:MAG TPA: dihydroorotate dehydrogenase [Candidatus Sumerlaeota bacterium]|nr:dihydroorotate dehydrogenase [Candidatus Sumerlaeota bacterium]
MTRPDLTTRLGALTLKNSVTVASGTYGYGSEYSDFYDPARLGALFLKGLTLEPRPGNAPQRLVETPSGLMNAIGLQNVGYERFVSEKLPVLEGLDTVIIANLCGSAIEDYVELARRLAELDRIDAAELNISCPNVRHGGMAFGCLPQSAAQITQAVREVFPKPLIVKLSPNVTDIAEMARAVEGAGADALSVVNTFVGLAIDIRTRRPKLGNVTGGLSGPAIRPMAVRMVWQCAKAVQIPIVGQGGITTWRDAAEFLLAGASAVSIGTANFTNPMAPIEVIEGIEAWLAEQGCRSVQEVIGALEV